MLVFRVLIALVSFALLLALPIAAAAAEAEPRDDVFAQRGDGILTHEQFDAAVERIDENRREGFLRSRSRLERYLDDLLLTVQLAAEGEQQGFADRPDIRARMAWAATEELARAWLGHYLENLPPADYEALAREQWLINKDRYLTKPTVDVTHILIGLESRSAEEALELARSLRDRLAEDPSLFDEFVAEFSDDPSAAGNQGRFRGVERGQMVRPFEMTAFSLEPGEISQPVRTVYGYHLIRLDAETPARQQTYDEVKGPLLRSVRAKHLEDMKTEYLRTFTTQPVELTEEDLREMVTRQFGEDAVVPAEEPAQSE